MSDLKFNGLPDYFMWTHNNPPAPFNDEFKPYAANAQTIAIKQLKDEGFYEKYNTPEVRKATGLIDERYQQICKEFESGKRSL